MSKNKQFSDLVAGISKCCLSPTWMVHGSSKCACRPRGWCTKVQNVYCRPRGWSTEVQNMLVAQVDGAQKFKMFIFTRMSGGKFKNVSYLLPACMVGTSKLFLTCRPHVWREIQNIYCCRRWWREIQKCFLLVAAMDGGKFKMFIVARVDSGKFKNVFLLVAPCGKKFKNVFLLVADVDTRKDLVRYVSAVTRHLQHTRQQISELEN